MKEEIDEWLRSLMDIQPMDGCFIGTMVTGENGHLYFESRSGRRWTLAELIEQFVMDTNR